MMYFLLRVYAEDPNNYDRNIPDTRAFQLF